MQDSRKATGEHRSEESGYDIGYDIGHTTIGQTTMIDF